MRNAVFKCSDVQGVNGERLRLLQRALVTSKIAVLEQQDARQARALHQQSRAPRATKRRFFHTPLHLSREIQLCEGLSPTRRHTMRSKQHPLHGALDEIAKNKSKGLAKVRIVWAAPIGRRKEMFGYRDIRLALSVRELRRGGIALRRSNIGDGTSVAAFGRGRLEDKFGCLHGFTL